MTSSKSPFLLIVFALLAGCGGGGGSGTGTGPSSSPTETNVLPVTVNGSLCSQSTAYINKPCVSVTVCKPGDASTCRTINDILLDTGSFGLRIFKSALNSLLLTPITSGSGTLAECAQFGDGSSEWGPVARADVLLALEPAVTVPIQVIDPTFANISTSSTSTICPGADSSPSVAHFNGILGVGVLSHDCGTSCQQFTNTGIYFSCTGSTCIGAAVPVSDQVQNPVALLPLDNNGVIVQLPGVPSGGMSSVNGSLVLGIGTRSNNVPSGATAYATNPFGEIITTLSSAQYSSIIDTGSNGLFFTPPSASQLPNCAAPADSWFCPATAVTLTAVNAGASGSPSDSVSFEIGNFTSLVSSNNRVFSNIGGYAPGIFDWGLPFYFGRDIYVGIEGKGSSLGSGPYWAY